MSLLSAITPFDFEGVKWAKLQRQLRRAVDNAGISYALGFPLRNIKPSDSEGDKWTILGAWMRLLADNVGGGGVSSILAGLGISVNVGTGDVTVTNTGVRSTAGTTGNVLVNGGTALATGAVTLSLPSALTGITSITCTGGDVGIARRSASVLTITDGSSGLGYLAAYVLWTGTAGSDRALNAGQNVGAGISGMLFSSTSIAGWCSGADAQAGALDVAMSRNAARVAELNTGAAGTFADLKLRNLIPSGGNGLAVFTVATLPATAGAGMFKGSRVFVTDSNAVSYTAGIGSVVAAGASTNVPVIYDGSNWRIG